MDSLRFHQLLITRKMDMRQITAKTLKSQSVDRNEAHRPSSLHEEDNVSQKERCRFA